ncbi:MAG: tetratricopeptide repeat protein [Deltaproteobacteria bacterium]|nr:tetratricopeptide repeat protein [Deltaproteobacteria bacterium]
MRPLAVIAALALVACGQPDPAAGQGGPPEAEIEAARRALADGNPRRALAKVADAVEGAGLVVRLRALVALSRWGDVERHLPTVPPGLEREALECLFASKREDVTATRKCEAAGAKPFEDVALGDEVRVALAAVYEREHRPDAAEATLKALVESRPTRPNRRALVDFYDRQGFVREAVAAAEAWLAAEPEDPTLKARLGQLLERKAKGDLLEKRWPEAEAAARRLLELVPMRHVARYLLADALDQLGKPDEARAERERARAAGAEPPPPPNSFPGLGPGEPGAHGHDGHEGHDHAHPPAPKPPPGAPPTGVPNGP